jgi:hypothetical protein
MDMIGGRPANLRDRLLHPCSDGVQRFLTAEVNGNYAGLLRLAGVENKFGGGQGI